jgi:hypothetical protein
VIEENEEVIAPCRVCVSSFNADADRGKREIPCKEKEKCPGMFGVVVVLRSSKSHIPETVSSSASLSLARSVRLLSSRKNKKKEIRKKRRLVDIAVQRPS